MLKQKVGNCYIQKTEPIKQKKRNCRYDTKGPRWRQVNRNHHIVIFAVAFINLIF